jgi:ADP-ribosylation factor-like protein 13B
VFEDSEMAHEVAVRVPRGIPVEVTRAAPSGVVIIFQHEAVTVDPDSTVDDVVADLMHRAPPGTCRIRLTAGGVPLDRHARIGAFARDWVVADAESLDVVSYRKVSAAPPDAELMIAILGLDGAGKTCLFRALCGDSNPETVPNAGLNQEVFLYDGVRKLAVYDLGGGRNFRGVWKLYFAELWGFVWVVDAADPERFGESRAELEKVLNHKTMRWKPWLIVANQKPGDNCDVRPTLRIDKKIKVFECPIVGEDARVQVDSPVIAAMISRLIALVLRNYTEIAKRRTEDLAEQKRRFEEEQAAKLERIEKLRKQEEEAKARQEAEAKAREEAEAREREEAEANEKNHGEEEEKQEAQPPPATAELHE